MRNRKHVVLAVIVLAALLQAGAALAATSCSFTNAGTTMTLDGDCTTDSTILVPDGWTLNGDGYTITAVDPAGGTFIGGIIANGGAEAHVTNVTVTVLDLQIVCHASADRFRGIYFEGASGSITHTRVIGINQGASGCQEGNAIDIRNAPFDGTHPNTVTVEVAHNYLDDWQKTGIVANGDVDISIHHNFVGDSATQANLAANGIQLGFGVVGSVVSNQIEGNQWLGASNFSATAILVFFPGAVEVSKNHISGNSDVGLFVIGNGGTYSKNNLSDNGPDGPHGDYGIVDLGSGNTFTKNHVSGFDTPFFPDPLNGMKNKALPVAP